MILIQEISLATVVTDEKHYKYLKT